MEVVLEMSFLAFSNTNFQFGSEKLMWGSYTAVKALPIANRVELINKKKFVKVALDENFKTFMVYIATLEIQTVMPNHFLRSSQI